MRRWAIALALALAPQAALADPCPAAGGPPSPAPLPAGPAPAPPPGAGPHDYRQQLRPTPHGWARRDHWCVWVEPAASEGPGARWDQLWLGAVDAALATWAELLPITRVQEPERAQVRVLRRRPPLREGRASHGRAELALVSVQRQGAELLEPLVSVALSPGQGPAALQATALHELGHAFGLWGHSEDPRDALAAVPGPRPVLRLSARDRATLLWLQQQPGLRPPERPPTAP